MQYKMLSIILASSLTALNSINASATPATPPATTQNQAQQQITWLGVYLKPVPQAIQAQLGKLLPQKGGAMIQNVQNASPAKTAGIQAFDIITHIDGKTINTVEQVYQTVQSRKAGTTIKLSILRNATPTDIDVKLATRQVTPTRQPRSPFGNTPFGNNPFGNNNNPFWGNPNPFNVPYSQPNWPSFNIPTPQMPNFPNLPAMPNAQSFSQAESLSMKTLPDGKIHIETSSKDSDGNTKEFIFEGDADDIKKQIHANKELPENQRQSLLQSLNMSPGSFMNNNFMQGSPSVKPQTPQPLPSGTLN
ncbi:MAG: Unknown protein [uncultured Thiotrichaceae bacterium]|uniref:PDZ domain-containing protein n=1 Tax=uncultured Thiotrichaceae bacterium TaxID=298394 RepID=A0A6S6SSG5_9GAMM|nr:MAG: Unknown protein [uncultured Thiotrichaceae bacterium]